MGSGSPPSRRSADGCSGLSAQPGAGAIVSADGLRAVRFCAHAAGLAAHQQRTDRRCVRSQRLCAGLSAFHGPGAAAGDLGSSGRLPVLPTCRSCAAAVCGLCGAFPDSVGGQLAALLAQSLRLGAVRRFFKRAHFSLRWLYAADVAASAFRRVDAFLALCAAIWQGAFGLAAPEYPAHLSSSHRGDPAGLLRHSLRRAALRRSQQSGRNSDDLCRAGLCRGRGLHSAFRAGFSGCPGRNAVWPGQLLVCKHLWQGAGGRLWRDARLRDLTCAGKWRGRAIYAERLSGI